MDTTIMSSPPAGPRLRGFRGRDPRPFGIRLGPVWVIGMAMGLGGCASRQAPTAEPGGPKSSCLQFQSDGLRAGTITVTTSTPLDPENVPQPAGETERMLFRHLYEPLIGVDCEGKGVEALAASWSSLAGGRIWRFVLRERAAFWDGTPVTPAAVRDSWTAWLRGRPERRGRPPWTWVLPESVRVTGERVLEVRLPRAPRDGPRLFAAPELAVAREGAPWPEGTGPYRVVPSAGGDTLLCRPNPRHPRPGRNPVRFIVHPGRDPRDLLSGEADLVLVREREALRYAMSLPDRKLLPLPWSRLYLLASRRLVCDPASPGALGALREELATQVMGAEGIAAAYFSYQAGSRETCTGMERPAGLPPPGNGETLRYPGEDADAGRIAARLVALAAAGDGGEPSVATCLPPGGSPVAEATGPDAWRASIAEGRDLGYVFSVRRSFPDPCLDFQAVEVPWLRLDSEQVTATPLVLARDVLVARKGLARVGIDWDGTPLLHETGWDPRPAVP